MKGAVAFFCCSAVCFSARIRLGRMVKRCLLLVEHISAQVVCPLVIVELCLVRVAAVLSETQFRLTPFGRCDRGDVGVAGSRSVGIKHNLCFIQALLIAVSAGLLAFGDALVEIDTRLFLIEFALLSGLRVPGGHFRSPWWGCCAVSSGAGRPM